MIMSNATSDIMSHLSKSILNNDDLSLVEQGAPAYLLMIDSLIVRAHAQAATGQKGAVATRLWGAPEVD